MREQAAEPEVEYAWSGTSDEGYGVYLVSDEDAEYPHAVLAVLGADGEEAESYVGRWLDPSSINLNTSENARGLGLVTDTEGGTVFFYFHESGSRDGSLSWDLGEGMGAVALEPCTRGEALAAVAKAGVDVEARAAAHETTESEALAEVAYAWKGENDEDGEVGYYAQSEDLRAGLLLFADSRTGAVTQSVAGGLFFGRDPYDGKNWLLVLDPDTPNFSARDYTYDEDAGTIAMSTSIGSSTATYARCDVGEATAAYRGGATTGQDSDSTSTDTDQDSSYNYIGTSKDGVKVAFWEELLDDNTLQGGLFIYDPSEAKSDSSYTGDYCAGAITTSTNEDGQSVYTVTDDEADRTLNFTFINDDISIEGVGEVTMNICTYEDWNAFVEGSTNTAPTQKA